MFEGDLADYLNRLDFFLQTQNPHAVSIGSGCDMIDDNVDTDDTNFQIAKKTIVRCMDTTLFSTDGIRYFVEYCKTYGLFDEPIDNLFQKFLEQNSSYTYYWVWPSITLQGSQNGFYSSSIQNTEDPNKSP
jgi:hypothetical protein